MLFLQTFLAVGAKVVPAGLSFRRIEVRVLGGKGGFGFLEPGVELPTHPSRPFGFLGKEVVSFSRVAGEIVQFVASVLVVVNQFPVTLHDDGTGFASLVAVMGIMPIEGAVFDFPAFQQGNQADPVHHLFLGRFDAAEIEQGGYQSIPLTGCREVEPGLVMPGALR